MGVPGNAKCHHNKNQSKYCQHTKRAVHVEARDILDHNARLALSNAGIESRRSDLLSGAWKGICRMLYAIHSLSFQFVGYRHEQYRYHFIDVAYQRE